MKSNLSEHQIPANFDKLERDEINKILEYMDEVPEAYVNFLIWCQIKDAIKQAEEEFALGQGDSEEPDYE